MSEGQWAGGWVEIRQVEHKASIDKAPVSKHSGFYSSAAVSLNMILIFSIHSPCGWDKRGRGNYPTGRLTGSLTQLWRTPVLGQLGCHSYTCAQILWRYMLIVVSIVSHCGAYQRMHFLAVTLTHLSFWGGCAALFLDAVHTRLEIACGTVNVSVQTWRMRPHYWNQSLIL